MDRDIVLYGTIAAVAILVVVAVPYVPGLVQHSPERVGRSAVPPPDQATSTLLLELRRDVTPVQPAKLQDEPVPQSSTASRIEPYRIAWPYDIADGLTFGPEGALKTRLAGLEGPSRDAVCNDRDGKPWACGLQARATLNNVTRRQTLLCNPAGPPAGGTVPARCRGDLDVARELVLAGFARPTGREPTLEAALQDAQRAERGLWNGGWTIRLAVR